jgi:hypothetical protein
MLATVLLSFTAAGYRLGIWIAIRLEILVYAKGK